MNKELDLESYPTLHLHLMVDDYYELIQRKKCEEGTITEADSYLDTPRISIFKEYVLGNEN